MAKEIQLTKGKVAIVDDDWYEMLSLVKWKASGQNRLYARRGERFGEKQHTEHMAGLIMDVPRSQIIVHMNKDTLDNRRENLQVGENSNVLQIAKKRNRATSKYKGVSWKTEKQKWCVQGSFGGVMKHIGYFHSEIEAAKAYNAHAEKYYGKFALLNEIN